MKAVPDSYREAALSLGASRWEIVYRVLFPAAKNGLLAAVLLGVGRAIGETMAVLMATGHAIQIPHSLLDPIRTLTATIAAELGEAVQGEPHYRVLFVIGLVLFAVTFVVNLTADLVVKGIRNERSRLRQNPRETQYVTPLAGRRSGTVTQGRRADRLSVAGRRAGRRCCSMKRPACATAARRRCRPGKSLASWPRSAGSSPGDIRVARPSVAVTPGRPRYVYHVNAAGRSGRRRRRHRSIALVGPGHGRRAIDPAGPGRPNRASRGQTVRLTHREVFTATSLERWKKVKETIARFVFLADGPGAGRADGGDPDLSAGPGLAGPLAFFPRAKTRRTT